MEPATKIAWALLALLHLIPAMTFFAPNLLERLYGVSPGGDVGILLTHRGALFAAVLVAALFAMFSPESRRLATLVVGVAVIGYLITYVRAGAPAGPLRKIAIPDAIGLIPLAFVTWRAWA